MTDKVWALLFDGLLETMYMTGVATFFAYLIGLPLGILLVITSNGHIRPHPILNSITGVVINFLRSIPFIILLALLIPVTRAVMGTAIRTRGMLFPLVISAFPYVARMIEGSLKEVDSNIVEAAESMGSSPLQIICKVLLPEALPSLINGAAIAIVAIIGYTAMANLVGGGGLGAIAMEHYQKGKRYYDIMYYASIAIVILVQFIAVIGAFLSRVMDHRRRKH